MKAGKLRNRVTLQRPNRLANELGEIVLSWVDVADVWAGIRPLSSNEVVRAAQAQLEITHAVTMRYNPDLRSDWRLKLSTPSGDRVLSIVSLIDVDEIGAEHRATCVEIKGA